MGIGKLSQASDKEGTTSAWTNSTLQQTRKGKGVDPQPDIQFQVSQSL